MAEEKKEPWLNYLALTTIIFAVAATLSTFKGGGFSTRSVLSQEQASNKWSYYQSKSLKLYLYETQKDLVIKVELAGVKKEDIKIFNEEDRLIIHGIRRETCPEGKIAYRQMEINYGPFEAIIQLITPIDEKKPISATISNGILEVKLPKAKEGKIHHIKIFIE